MNMVETVRRRSSVRRYTGQPVSRQQVLEILQAGLLSPSSGALRPWELFVVEAPEQLARLGKSRPGSISMLCRASAAIVVVGEPERSEFWVEDCAAVMAQMHLAAAGLGLGSCWIQGRGKDDGAGGSLDERVREILGYRKELTLEAILSLGVPASEASRRLPEALWDKVHWS